MPPFEKGFIIIHALWACVRNGSSSLRVGQKHDALFFFGMNQVLDTACVSLFALLRSSSLLYRSLDHSRIAIASESIEPGRKESEDTQTQRDVECR